MMLLRHTGDQNAGGRRGNGVAPKRSIQKAGRREGDGEVVHNHYYNIIVKE
jgi:hypothetical protein